jgi:hypothetical protein
MQILACKWHRGPLVRLHVVAIISYHCGDSMRPFSIDPLAVPIYILNTLCSVALMLATFS